MSGSGRSSTPPRRGANPGTTVDPNFVADDWDDDDNDIPSRNVPQARAESKGSGSESRERTVSIGANVKADDNWLDENFDDD